MTKESKRQKLAQELKQFAEQCDEFPSRTDTDVPGGIAIPVQYSALGKGWTPINRTARKLPSGVYRLEQVDGRTVIYPANIVTDKLVRFPDTKSDFVIDEIFKFWKSPERFERLGYAYRRGFLLWGDAGSGKTSVVKVVTNEMVSRGGVVVMGDCHPEILVTALAEIRMVEPERPLVVIMEDIDAIIERYCESTVLALLDGEYSIDNVVFIATTNYPEKLDKRVVNRPSRFDRVVKIGMPSEAARRIYLKSRELELSDKELDRWVKETEGLSIAHIKELICDVYCFENPFDEELKRIRKMFYTPKSDDNAGPVGFGCGKDD